MKDEINWDYEALSFYQNRMLQVILMALVGEKKADKIHKNILEEISEFQKKRKFMEKMEELKVISDEN